MRCSRRKKEADSLSEKLTLHPLLSSHLYMHTRLRYSTFPARHSHLASVPWLNESFVLLFAFRPRSCIPVLIFSSLLFSLHYLHPNKSVFPYDTYALACTYPRAVLMRSVAVFFKGREAEMIKRCGEYICLSVYEKLRHGFYYELCTVAHTFEVI